VERARDVGLVALGLLPHVEYLHGALLEQPFQVVELDGDGGFRHPALGDVAAQLEESDGTQPTRGLLRLGVVGRVNDDSLVRIENEPGAGRERRAGEGNVERPVEVSCCMCLRRANIEDGRLAGVLEVLELCGRANEWSLVERDDPSSRRWTWCRERSRRVDERLRVAVLELLVRALLVADRRE
jgi:hypothetical protein